MQTLDLINHQTIKQMISDTSIEVIPDLLGAFIDELTQHEQAVQRANGNQDIIQIAEEAHALKSCSGTFGASRLHHCAMLLEEKARAGTNSVQMLSSDIEHLLSLVNETTLAYKQFQLNDLSL